ncbi:unnamed protein product [Peronospora belbahrii]|uniref:RING-type domain-containing protein n=1 Tax=Peronospora belbahrii TaxID=622444 RepID=A0AAU9LPF1_9STRA|nr:unnamed protein product [Peronospora belbahrii]
MSEPLKRKQTATQDTSKRLDVMAENHEEMENTCPLCMEELDLTDQTFNACPCGYQVCLWCWHQIKNEYNGLCPACRQPYAELSKQKNSLDREEVVRRAKQRKQKEKNDRRSGAQAKYTTGNRKSLQNVRVMQRNLVYVIGLPVRFADEDILRSNECFSQYGKIVKAVVNKSHLTTDRSNATASGYITFAHKEDAQCCIMAIDGYSLDGSVLRASFGTTKYCNFFLRNMQCNNPDCLYLHELGDEEDSFTKEEMQAALHSRKATFRDVSMVNEQTEDRAGSRFPPPRRPSTSSSSSGASASAKASSPARGTTLDRSHSEEVYGDKQRHAQSAAAISKLRQASGDSNNSPGSSPQDRLREATTQNTEYPPLAREDSYSKIVSGKHNSSKANVAAMNQSDDVHSTKPQLRVDTSREEDTTLAVDSVVRPLEALKLVTGSSTEQPAWAQPFPTPSVCHDEKKEHITTNATSSDTSNAADVYSPFGLGFEGGICRASSARELMSNSPGSSSVWKSSNASDDRLSSLPPAAPITPVSTSSASSFASIDAIFSQRKDPSEALAGLLGIRLNSNPLVHGAPLTVPPKDEHISRFSFANSADVSRSGMPHTSDRYELLDTASVDCCRSFGGFNAARAGNAPLVSSGFPSPTDRSGFPPLGSSQQQLHHAPPLMHPSSSSFGGDYSNSELPRSNSGAVAGESGGLAFLQQMLPNVNISFGGDYPGLFGTGSSGVDKETTPARTTNVSRDRAGRRLFERRQSGGGSCVPPDSWDGGSFSSFGFDGQSSSQQTSGGLSIYDPALVPQSSNGFSSDFYGFSSSSSTVPGNTESERLCMQGDFGGET